MRVSRPIFERPNRELRVRGLELRFGLAGPDEVSDLIARIERLRELGTNGCPGDQKRNKNWDLVQFATNTSSLRISPSTLWWRSVIVGVESGRSTVTDRKPPTTFR